MSETYLKLIPEDPAWVPTDASRRRALAWWTRRLSGADEAVDRLSDDIRFVDAGVNFESVSCPGCRESLSLKWWSTAMDQAFQSAFKDLIVTPPCCGRPSSLNDLLYGAPQGFSRYELTARNPRVYPEDLRLILDESLDYFPIRLRAIWSRL